MILLTAIAAGIVVGVVRAWCGGGVWQLPGFQRPWLIVVAFLPQFLAFYLPVTRKAIPDSIAAAILVGSQFLLLVFCLVNWRIAGVVFLGMGLTLNLCAILANGGFMPLSSETAARILPPYQMETLETGKRLGVYSKDVLLEDNEINLPWLADRFIAPMGFPYQFVFSIGDVLIAIGAFWSLVKPEPIAFPVLRGET